MQNVADLLRAIATLLWPLLAIASCVYFRSEISEFLKRLKRGKLLGQELELGDSLDHLNKNAVAAADEVAIAALKEESLPNRMLPDLQRSDDESGLLKGILQLAQTSPKIALMALAIEIEKELREILFSQGEMGKPYRFRVPEAAKVLQDRELLLPHVRAAISNFQEVRNKILHSVGRVSDDEILRAIDSGILILKSLKLIPRPRYFVHRADIDLYMDSNTAQMRPGVWGVMLEVVHPLQKAKTYSIHPSTKHYREGQQVAWEWDGSNDWGDTWYRDPDTNETKQAWSESLEFVGRNLDEV